MHKMKRFLSVVLTVCMLVSILSTGALALTITEKPDNGTTEGQPFLTGAGGSTNFRIPGIVTLNDGTLIAACDARWNHTGDGAGLDTIVAVSTDNGANWTNTYANYLGDNGNTFNNLSTCIIDPAIGTDGETAYLIADLFPAGIALNTSKYAPIATENGFDDDGHLLLRALSEDTIAIGSDGYNTMAGDVSRYQFYLDLDALTLHNADGTAIEGYTVDPWFNIVSDDGTLNTNLFFADSPYQPYPTDYLYLVKSTDGLEWSEPELLNLQEDGEQTLLIGPGNGTYDAANDRVVFTAYEYTSGYQRTSLLWMDAEGNWKRTADATGNTWSSEATAVVLDDGTVRCFFRDGYDYLRYTDYVWSDSEANYVVSNREVGTTATKRSNNQLTSIRYSQQIEGKDVILVACAASPDAREDGHLYVFLVDEDNTMTLAYDYDIIPGEIEYYAYNCITEMDDGRIALLYEGDYAETNAYGEIIFTIIDMADVTARENDTRLSFVDIELLTGDTYTTTDNSGCYVDADLSELDTDVATVELTGEEITTNAAMVLSNSANIDLDSCQYTFTASGNYFHISAEVDGTTVYLNHYSSTGNNTPNVTSPAGEIAVLQGTVEGMFRLQAQAIAGSGSGVARTLHFHAESGTPYWNRCGNDTSYKCHEYLFRKATADEVSSTEIPGYVRLTSVDQVVDGGKYLIAAKNDAGNWYVLNPANSTTSLAHVAQIMGSTTVGYTDLTFTGVGAGCTEVQIGSTVYKLTVTDYMEIDLQIPVGTSVTVTESSGNNADADVSKLDQSIASVALTGLESATELTFTGVYPGATELAIGRTLYKITVTGDVVDVELKVGESAFYIVNGEPEIAVPADDTIAKVTTSDAQVARLGTDASYTGEYINLSEALFTFTANEDGTYIVSSGDYYLEGYASNNGYPVVTYPTNITVGNGFSDGTVTLYSSSASAGRSGYLFFWRDGKNYYDRVDKTGGFETGVSFYLYEQLEDGSYAAIAGKDAIVSGSSYLIVADAGDYGKFVTYPTTARTTRYTQIAKMAVGTKVTIEALAAGETSLTIPGTYFGITVTSDHEHSYEAVVTAPTCTEGGYTTYTCECGDSYVADETAALGHSEETVPGKEATCTEPGLTEGKKCSVCGEVTVAQEEIPALGHDYVDGICTVCGAEDPDYVPEVAVIASGWSGYTTWVLTSDGTLTFSPTEYNLNGETNMKNYWKVDGVLTLPWSDYAEQITKVVIEDGIHDIGQMAFYELPNLAVVEFGADVTEIRGYAFKNCTSLTTINLGGVDNIRQGAFYGCSALADLEFAEGVVIEAWAFTRTPYASLNP